MAVQTLTERARAFTSYDFDSWILELRSLATAAYPTWTDFNTADFGNFLLELFAHTLDVVSYAQGWQYHATRVRWARTLKAMIALGANVGFALPGPEAASVDLELTISAARVASLTIPAGTIVQPEGGGAQYELLEDAVIPAGEIQVEDVPSENAHSTTYAFVATGEAGLQVILPEVPYVEGSASATVGVDDFEESEDLAAEGPTALVFEIRRDADGRATMVFGDGTNGAIPTGSGAAVYKTGGGTAGRVEADALDTFKGGNRFLDDRGVAVAVLVRNPSPSSGGVDAMTVEEARVAIPGHVRTAGKRTVAKSDYETNAKRVRGVARALFMTSDDDPSIDENTGKLYVIPVGGGLPSTTLKDAVHDLIVDEYPVTTTFTFSVEDPLLLQIPVTATVALNRGVTEAQARTAIETALDALFALQDEDGVENPRIDFGYRIRTEVMAPGATLGEVPFSDIIDAIRNATLPNGTRAIRKVDEDTLAPPDDVPVADTEFPVLANVVLFNADTGLGF